VGPKYTAPRSRRDPVPDKRLVSPWTASPAEGNRGRGMLAVAVVAFELLAGIPVQADKLSTAHFAAVSGPNPVEWSMANHSPNGTRPRVRSLAW